MVMMTMIVMMLMLVPATMDDDNYCDVDENGENGDGDRKA